MSQNEKGTEQSAEKKTSPNKSPIKVIRCGAIAASVWKRQTSTGFEYLDYSISRSWKLKSGEREGYSQNFFEGNEEALFEVVNLASRYIREQQMSSDQQAATSVDGSEMLAA